MGYLAKWLIMALRMALNRKLIPGRITYRKGSVRNLPLLLEHLRELRVAKDVLDCHLCSIAGQPLAQAEQGFTSLAILHCIQSHAWIMANLTLRLEAACEKLTGVRLGDPDKAEEAMMGAYYEGKKATFFVHP